MYESAIALQMMSVRTAKVTEFKQTGLPYISCMVDPCYGGITGSFASLGDICISDSNDAMIGFAGQRIIKAQTPGEVIEDSFQKAVALKKHGFLDAIIERDVLNEKIGNLLSILLKKNELETTSDVEPEQQDREFIKRTAASS